RMGGGWTRGGGGGLRDSGNYHSGLGVAPGALVGTTAIFGPTAVSEATYENTAYTNNSRISSNSWLFVDQFNNPIPDYESEAQAYDSIVRDARPSLAGNQEYTVVFAAGNDGPTANTVSTPGTAKNVI